MPGEDEHAEDGGANVNRQTSKRQQEKAPEGRQPHEHTDDEEYDEAYDEQHEAHDEEHEDEEQTSTGQPSVGHGGSRFAEAL